jgi:7,8-dihydroneopterin aldolase/epimerase/oxygenase
VTDAIELRGLRITALVGALPEERERPQPLEIDLEILADLAAAGSSDRLDDTVDYGAVCDAVEKVFGDGHVALLETVAERIASSVLATDARVTGVTVAVRKLHPPVSQDLATSGVRITRQR